MKGFTQIAIILVLLVVIVVIAVIFGAGLGLSAGGGGGIDFTGGQDRDYKIEISDVRISGEQKEGETITIAATYVCDFDEPCTFLAWARLQPGDSYFPQASVITGSECCNKRDSEGAKTITLQPDAYTRIEFEVTIPREDSFAECSGTRRSYYSTNQKYYVKIGANRNCYGAKLMELRPFEINVQKTVDPVSVTYNSIDFFSGRNLNHYIDGVFAGPGQAQCTQISGSPRIEYSCPVGTSILVVKTRLSNNNNKNVQFLSEAIMHPARLYDPWGVLPQATFLPQASFSAVARSCCGDTFSQAYWIKTTPGEMESLTYILKVPTVYTRGQCNERSYHSPSGIFYIKISDYIDCAEAQVQDLQPILVRIG